MKQRLNLHALRFSIVRFPTGLSLIFIMLPYVFRPSLATCCLHGVENGSLLYCISMAVNTVPTSSAHCSLCSRRASVKRGLHSAVVERHSFLNLNNGRMHEKKDTKFITQSLHSPIVSSACFSHFAVLNFPVETSSIQLRNYTIFQVHTAQCVECVLSAEILFAFLFLSRELVYITGCGYYSRR